MAWEFDVSSNAGIIDHLLGFVVGEFCILGIKWHLHENGGQVGIVVLDLFVGFWKDETF